MAFISIERNEWQFSEVNISEFVSDEIETLASGDRTPLWTGPHLHSTCQALNKRKWFWRSAKATWLWLGARSMLKLFKNWFTITNTNNMRPEKILNIYFQMFYVCGLAAYLKTMPTYVIQFLRDMSIFFSSMSNISSPHGSFCNHSSKSWKISLIDFLHWHYYWFSFRNSLVIQAAAICLGLLFRMSSVYFSLFNHLLSSFGSFVVYNSFAGSWGSSTKPWLQASAHLGRKILRAVAFCVANVVLSSAAAGFIRF